MKHAIIAAAALFSFSAPAAAATVVVTGNTTGDPTYNRPSSTTSLSVVGTAVPYEVTAFTVGTTGSYSMALNAVTVATYDTFLSLYSTSFSPTSALTNLLAVNDDAAGIGNSLITFTLTAGTSYFSVASGFANDDFGAYTLTISGPGTVTVGGATPAVPEPATWAMLIGGFGMVGGTLRRRMTVRAAIA